MMHRRPGGIGAGSTPGRVWKNTKMPGRMGGKRVTVQNLKVVQSRPEDNVLLISGTVPGAKGASNYKTSHQKIISKLSQCPQYFNKRNAEAANISLTEPGEGTQAVHDVVVAMRPTDDLEQLDQNS